MGNTGKGTVVVRLLNFGRRPAEAERVWLEPAEPFAIGNAALVVYVDRNTAAGCTVDEWRPRIEWATGCARLQWLVPAGWGLGPNLLGGYGVIPLALEMVGGRPSRVFVEILRRSAGRKAGA